MSKRSREQMRQRRHTRVRKKVAGTSDRPRLNVHRSLTSIRAQVIDDSLGHDAGLGLHAGERDP